MTTAFLKLTVRPCPSVSLPFVQDLQEDVEDLGVGLLDLV